MRKLVFAALAITAATPALAGEFFIVRGESEKECRIVETRPAEKTVVVVGDRAYVTREEAEKDLTLVCKKD